MEKFRSFSKDLQGMSSDNGKGGSVNANEQTIFQLIKDFRLAREADEAMKLRAREQRMDQVPVPGADLPVIVAGKEMLTSRLKEGEG